MKSAAAMSRRSLLGLVAVGLAGCKSGSSASAPHIDPDASALASARTSEAALVAAYDAYLSAIEGGPGAVAQVLAERSVHAEHLAALGGSPVSPSASAAPARPSIRSLLRSSASTLRGAAVAAIDGAHAAVLASIAASHEVMARD